MLTKLFQMKLFIRFLALQSRVQVRNLTTSTPYRYRYYTEMADFKVREYNFWKMYTSTLPSLEAKLNREELDEISDIVYASLGQTSNKYIDTKSNTNDEEDLKNNQGNLKGWLCVYFFVCDCQMSFNLLSSFTIVFILVDFDWKI